MRRDGLGVQVRRRPKIPKLNGWKPDLVAVTEVVAVAAADEDTLGSPVVGV